MDDPNHADIGDRDPFAPPAANDGWSAPSAAESGPFAGPPVSRVSAYPSPPPPGRPLARPPHQPPPAQPPTAPQNWAHPHDPRQSPNPHHQPTSSDVVVRRVLVGIGAVVVAIVFLVVVRWFLWMLFSGSAVATVVLVVLGGAAVGGYLFYRNVNPDRARALEAQVKYGSQTAIARVTAALQSTNGPAAPTGWGPPGSVPYQGPTAPPPAPQTAPAAAPIPPPISQPLTGPTPIGPVTRPQATQWPGPAYGMASPGNQAGVDILKNAALLIPSFIVYAVLFNWQTYTSIWQPWWLLTLLNVYFVIVVGVRARIPGRGTPAVLLGAAGTLLIGLASSPSNDWNLGALLGRRESYAGVAYSVPPPELVPWLLRMPVIALLFFVAAWGVSRRRQSPWALGLVPATIMVAVALWYRENEWTGTSGGFGYWLMNAGVFLGGCLACWAIDAMSTPRTPPPQNWYGQPGPAQTPR